MRAFDDLVRQGKILYAGVSDMPAWVVAKANTLAELRGWTPFVGLQIEYSLIERTPERELLPMAADLGLGVTAWSPLAGGMLTGKQLEPGGAKDSRQANPSMQQFMKSNARKESIAREVVAVAREMRPLAGAGGSGLAQATARAGDPDHRRSQTDAGQGQPRLRWRPTRTGSHRAPRCGQPDRDGFPARLLRHRHGAVPVFRRNAGPNRRLTMLGKNSPRRIREVGNEDKCIFSGWFVRSPALPYLSCLLARVSLHELQGIARRR